MKKVEIEIDEELFGDWEPVAFRIPKDGEYYAHLSDASSFAVQPLIACKNEDMAKLVIKKKEDGSNEWYKQTLKNNLNAFVYKYITKKAIITGNYRDFIEELWIEATNQERARWLTEREEKNDK